VSDVLGATLVQPTSCARVTPVVAPGCAPQLSRERRSGPEPWSLLQSGHAARVEDCACRGLERAATPSGAALWLRSSGLISGAATPRAKSVVARQDTDPVSLGRRGCAPTQAPVWAGPLSGGAVRPVPPSGGACEDSADGQRPARASLGRQDADAVQNANVRPSLSREAR